MSDLAIERPPLRLHALRARSYLWRFRTLEGATRAFSPERRVLLARRFCGHRLVVDVSRSNVQRLLWLEGKRFVQERAILERLLRPGMTVVDVGANIGYYLLMMQQLVGAHGKLTCVEPEPDNLIELRRNIAANQLENVDVVAAALGPTDGTANILTGMNGHVVDQGEGEIRVPMRRLDSIAPQRVDFIKIDVEGYEGQVLQGAMKVLERDRPSLVVELHPWMLAAGDTVKGILSALRERYDVELFELRPQRDLPAKLRARYLGRGVRAIVDVDRLLVDCASGLRREPFWAVCPRS